MNLATIEGGGPDGTLVVVSDDHQRMALPNFGPRTLREALERWDYVRNDLESLAAKLADPDAGLPFQPHWCLSPLPRTFLWAEGSCYLSHMERIRGSRGQSLPPDHRHAPLIYQSGGDANIAPTSDVRLASQDWDLDVEGTLVVYIDHIPQSASAEVAQTKIRLVGFANDFTYRGLIAEEYARGGGFYRSKPSRSFAPVVVDVDGLGEAWTNGWIHGSMRTCVNDRAIGSPRSEIDLGFSIGELLSYLASTRPLSAGSIVGTGTVSNRSAAQGVGCIAELRAEEAIQGGAPETPFLRSGDTVEITYEVDGNTAPFGKIRHRLV